MTTGYGYDVNVEWMDGRKREFFTVTTTEKDGILTILGDINHLEKKVVAIIPLNNVREVRFP